MDDWYAEDSEQLLERTKEVDYSRYGIIISETLEEIEMYKLSLSRGNG